MNTAVRDTWSHVDVRQFGPYREQLMAELARRAWRSPEARQELLQRPRELLRREVGLEFDRDVTVRVIEDTPGTFTFVLPRRPSQEELWYRYEQISGWWMLAHAFWWWAKRARVPDADSFLPGLEVQIIGRSWNDPAWRSELAGDVKATLAKETGLRFPADLRMEVVEDSDSEVHLTLPRQPEAEGLVEDNSHLGAHFLAAHSWWYWLVCARLHSPAASTVSGMVG